MQKTPRKDRLAESHWVPMGSRPSSSQHWQEGPEPLWAASGPPPGLVRWPSTWTKPAVMLLQVSLSSPGLPRLCPCPRSASGPLHLHCHGFHTICSPNSQLVAPGRSAHLGPAWPSREMCKRGHWSFSLNFSPQPGWGSGWRPHFPWLSEAPGTCCSHLLAGLS